VLFGAAASSAASVDRSRVRIPLLCITGAIPRRENTKGKHMSNHKTATAPVSTRNASVAAEPDPIPVANSKQPAARVNLHPVYASIWRNQNAEGAVFYSVTVQRRYRDAKNVWNSSESFNEGDLLLAAKVLDMAHTEITKLRATDREAQKSQEQPA
jgi:hypothetical protein